MAKGASMYCPKCGSEAIATRRDDLLFGYQTEHAVCGECFWRFTVTTDAR